MWAERSCSVAWLREDAPIGLADAGIALQHQFVIIRLARRTEEIQKHVGRALPPGRNPSSTVPRVADIASSTRSLRSTNDTPYRARNISTKRRANNNLLCEGALLKGAPLRISNSRLRPRYNDHSIIRRTRAMVTKKPSLSEHGGVGWHHWHL
jgi:hypothetical protein